MAIIPFQMVGGPHVVLNRAGKVYLIKLNKNSDYTWTLISHGWV